MRKGGYRSDVSRVTRSPLPLLFPAPPFPCPRLALTLPFRNTQRKETVILQYFFCDKAL